MNLQTRIARGLDPMIQHIKTARNRAATLGSLLAVCSVLYGCGGGGSGSGAPSASTVSSAPPAISYSGVSTPANFNDGNAGQIADGMFSMTFLALDIAENIQSPASQIGPISYTSSGPQGGSVTVTGMANTDTTGWVQGNFSNYKRNGVTYNGREVIEITQPLTGTTPQLGRISYYDLHATGANIDVDYLGTINRQVNDAMDLVWIITGSVLIHDLKMGTEWYAQDINITRETITGGRQLSVHSRVSESKYGYVDVVTAAPWVFAENITTPDHGGPLVGTGIDFRTLAIGSLTPQLGAIEYMSKPAPKPDRSVRINWTAPASQQITSQSAHAATVAASGGGAAAPIADAGAAITLAPGTAWTLDGRFSYQPNGVFLGYTWILRSQPPGSTAAFDDVHATRPSITFDQPGSYLIELTASDGTNQTTDAISIPVRPSGVVAGSNSVPVQLAPDQKVQVGQPVTFTLQVPHTSFGPLPSFYLEYWAPDGQNGYVAVNADNTYQFTPTVPGTYRILLTEFSGVQLDDQWLAAGMDFRFLPEASVPRPLSSPEFWGSATGDVNGDGYPDLVISATDYSLNSSLEIYHGNAAGGFDPPVILRDGLGGPVAVGDFNGDGRADIAVATPSGFDVLLQRANGTLAPPQSYTVGCFMATDQSILAAGDFNGDGRTDIVIGACNQKVWLFVQGTDGLMHQSIAVAVPASTAGQFAVADLNGDGLADVAIAFATGTPGNIVIIPGDRTTGLGMPHSLAESFLPPALGLPYLAVGDINGDGRADLLFSVDDNLGNTSIHVYLQQPNGTLQPGPPLATHGMTTGIYVADLNRDGRNDVAVAGGDGPGLSIRYQNAGGSLAPPLLDNRFFDSDFGAPIIGLMDVDRNGSLDVLGFGGVGLILGYDTSLMPAGPQVHGMGKTLVR